MQIARNGLSLHFLVFGSYEEVRARHGHRNYLQHGHVIEKNQLQLLASPQSIELANQRRYGKQKTKTLLPDVRDGWTWLSLAARFLEWVEHHEHNVDTGTVSGEWDDYMCKMVIFCEEFLLCLGMRFTIWQNFDDSLVSFAFGCGCFALGVALSVFVWLSIFQASPLCQNQQQDQRGFHCTCKFEGAKLTDHASGLFGIGKKKRCASQITKHFDFPVRHVALNDLHVNDKFCKNQNV